MNCSPDNWKPDQDKTWITCHQLRSVFACLPDHCHVTLVTQVWPGNLCTLPTLPLLIITIHQPLACSPLGYQGEEVKLPAAMLSQVTPDSVSQ